MKKLVVALSLLPLALAFGEGEKKISLFTAIDFGRVEKGYDLQKGYDPSGVFLNRTYVDVGFNQQLDEQFFISIGVGGIFWKAFEGSGGNPEDKVIKFGPGISKAFMKYSLSPALDVSFGYFPYRYNNAAKNLGEYLFRTEAYPTIIYTGGWSWMNDVAYHTVGAKLSWNIGDGVFKQDIGLFTEYFNSPIYDITPAYIATLKPFTGFTVGGAAALHRFISPTPQTKKELTKSYTYRENFYFPALSSKAKYNVDIPDYNQSFDIQWYTSAAAPTSLQLDSLRGAIWAADSVNLKDIYNVTSPSGIQLAKDPSPLSSRKGHPEEIKTQLDADIQARIDKDALDSAAVFSDPHNQNSVAKSVSFDNAAIMVLAFFELNFNDMLGLDAKRAGEFNLYGEIAQLGLKNYPIFYTKSSERRPIMLGASIPTFFLDHMSFEVEYLKNPNVESIASTYDKLDLPPDENFRYKTFSKDDLKWSFHASRSFAKFFSIHVQVANDHMRLKDGFARPQYVPVTNEKGHWYWLTRLQWAI